MPKKSMATLQERINKYILYVGYCWIWTGCKTTGGYPVIRNQNKTLSVRRFLKPTKPELFLKVSCSSPLCVNPKHLRPVTRSYTKKLKSYVTPRN